MNEHPMWIDIRKLEAEIERLKDDLARTHAGFKLKREEWQYTLILSRTAKGGRMMSLLILNEIQKAKVKEVVGFAQTNLYYPFKSETIPGDDARHVVNIPVGYRCVFSITVGPDGKHWRHLSISIPKREKYPHPTAAFAIANLFGFTGYDADHRSETPPRDWLMDINKEDNCVVLAQEFRKADE